MLWSVASVMKATRVSFASRLSGQVMLAFAGLGQSLQRSQLRHLQSLHGILHFRADLVGCAHDGKQAVIMQRSLKLTKGQPCRELRLPCCPVHKTPVQPLQLPAPHRSQTSAPCRLGCPLQAVTVLGQQCVLRRLYSLPSSCAGSLTSVVEDGVVIISAYPEGLAAQPVPQSLVVLEACDSQESAWGSWSWRQEQAFLDCSVTCRLQDLLSCELLSQAHPAAQQAARSYDPADKPDPHPGPGGKTRMGRGGPVRACCVQHKSPVSEPQIFWLRAAARSKGASLPR